MKRRTICLLFTCIIVILFSGAGFSANIDELLDIIPNNVSGGKARDYTMRLWRYDKWSTLPMWQKSAGEAQKIMRERAFDEAVVVDTPADGRTKFGTWVNPLGWDVKEATLEVIEPANLPDEYRYLCNYSDAPTSLGNWSCPTPPEGIETELVLLEKPDLESLRSINARGKIILTSHSMRPLKRYFDEMGILGAVCAVRIGDFINAHHWLNGWSDMPGGWLMNDYDSKNQFRFSISHKKAEYLRNILRQGKKVVVRAKIDSRYYTNGSLPYVTGCIKGAGNEGEEILIVGHLYEWGANDNSTGCASILEAVGALNDMIRSGMLPRPERSIRVCFGHEMWGMMAYTHHNLERLRDKTIAVVNVDGPAGNRELSRYHITVIMNPYSCPSFTDALFPEFVKRYYSRYVPYKLSETSPYIMWDGLFADPSIGVPSNTITFFNLRTAYDMYHNSMDTIEKVDPRSLHDLASINAIYLYYLASSGFDEIPYIEQLTFDRGIQMLLEKSRELTKRLDSAGNGEELGRELFYGARAIEYYCDLQKQALKSTARIVSDENREKAEKDISKYTDEIDEYCALIAKQFRGKVQEKAKNEKIKIVKYSKEKNAWTREAEKTVPKRKYVGTITLMDIPHEQWKEVKSSPKSWSATDWASASLWWCDGKRNLNEIKELVELEAGRKISNFDLIEYYKFLKEYNLIEFVK